MRVIGLLALLAATALCAAAPVARASDPVDPGRTEAFQWGTADRPYPYIVYTPTSYSPRRAAPLLVMTHGCQTTAEQQMRANLYNQLAEREGFVVMYPDVDYTAELQPGPTYRCWRFPDPGSWHRDSGDAGAIAGMTRDTMARMNIDPERVYAIGMSAGGFMTSILAAAYPDLYAAVGIVAAGAYADGTCLFGNPAALPVEVSAQLARDEMGERARVVPRLVVGGDGDEGVTPACQDKAFFQGLRTNNLVLGDRQDAPINLEAAGSREVPAEASDGYPSTVTTFRDPGGCVVGERWLVHGMNHYWPGGSADPQWSNWTDQRGPSGARISWEFFERYAKGETGMPCAEADRYRLRAAPRTARRGKRTLFRFTASASREGRKEPLSGKSVCLAGKCARTGERGHARFTATLPQAREYSARLRVGGATVATASVLATG